MLQKKYANDSTLPVRPFKAAGVSYAVINRNAVAAWVATKDDCAEWNPRDVDLRLRESELDRATAALHRAGFHRDKVLEVTGFLDGKDSNPVRDSTF